MPQDTPRGVDTPPPPQMINSAKPPTTAEGAYHEDTPEFPPLHIYRP